MRDQAPPSSGKTVKLCYQRIKGLRARHNWPDKMQKSQNILPRLRGSEVMANIIKQPKPFVPNPIDTVLCVVKPSTQLKGYEVSIGGLTLFAMSVEEGRAKAICVLEDALDQLREAPIAI